MKLWKLLGIMVTAALLAACTGGPTINHSPTPTNVNAHQQWAVLPFENNTEMPHAGEKVSAITTSLLRSRGVRNVVQIQPTSNQKLVTTQGMRQQQVKQALRTARARHIPYAMTGTVNEWRYKAGLDGEPAVGVTLNLIDTRTGRVVWSAAASDAGWGKDSLADIAQNLIDDSLDSLPLTSGVYYGM